MSKPIRGTVLWGCTSGLAFLAAISVFSHSNYWPEMIKAAATLNLAVYGILLTKWSGKELRDILISFGVLFFMHFVQLSGAGFYLLLMVILCWIRSTLWADRPIHRLLIAEIVCLGSFWLIISRVGLFGTSVLSVLVLLFYLFQALYFYIVLPLKADSSGVAPVDRFERVFAEATRLISRL